MRHLRALIRLLLVAAILLGGYTAYLTYRGQPHLVDTLLARVGLGAARVTPAGVQASGTLEATRVQVMALVPGRVVEVTVEEGDEVSRGQAIVRLDDSLLHKQLAAAAADIDAARAQLDLLQAGPRAEEVAHAEAQLAAAQVAVDVAAQALADARAIRDAAQDIWPDIIRAETEVTKTLYLRDAALARAQAADIAVELWRRINDQVKAGTTITLPTGEVKHIAPPPEKVNEVSFQWNKASQEAWQAWAQYEQAQAAVAAAQTALEAARARLNDPARDVPVAQALAAYENALAAVPVAQAAVDALREGVNAEKIAAAEANLRRAQAAYDRLAATRRYYTLTAPIAGRVLSVDIHPGEVAMPGVPLVEIGDTSHLELTLYVAESDLGKIRLGDEVTITVDAYPGRTFSGRVVHIADEAEFTPKSVQTREERTTLVYAVKVDVPNDAGLLKPGMPADAVIGAEGTAPAPLEPRRFTLPFFSAVRAPAEKPAGEFTVSGTFEATKIRVMPEVSARVMDVLVDEGEDVQAGQVVAHLDPGDLPERISEAQAALDAAEAQLADLKAQPLPGKVNIARAQVAQAEANLRAARIRLQAARAALENPVELDSQIARAEAQLPLLEGKLEEARAQKKAAEVEREFYASQVTEEGRHRHAIAEKLVAAAQANLRAVQADIAGTRRLIAFLKDIRQNPLALQAQVHRAEGEVRLAEAQLDVARKALLLAQAPARAEEVAAAQARVDQARAMLALLQAQLERYTLTAPVSGRVLSRAAEPGETVQAGTALLEIGDVSVLELTVFVPEPDLGRVYLGQPVQVRVDTYPDRVFEGRVVWIADEAEFTPRNVQTREDRMETVYRVKVRVSNQDDILKPGMPADATFRPAP